MDVLRKIKTKVSADFKMRGLMIRPYVIYELSIILICFLIKEGISRGVFHTMTALNGGNDAFYTIHYNS